MFTRKPNILILYGIILMASCAPGGSQTAMTVVPAGAAAPTSPVSAADRQYPWWNKAVFYEVFVRSFYDSNADGIGDLQGLIQKLDYLNDGNPATVTDLGVSALWLMPVYPSPSYHGYDVLDYYSINPDYGTIQDFAQLLEEAHARGIRVIIDLVINHTSDKHPWFAAAQDPASPYRDWYVWAESNPHLAGWHKAAGGEGYYFGLFWGGMPDLNLENPAVTQEIYDIAAFWLEQGVDGFRLDAAKHLIEEGSNYSNTQATHTWWKAFRTYIKDINPEALILGETWDESVNVAKYVQGDEHDMDFDFGLAYGYVSAAARGQAIQANYPLRQNIELFPPNTFAAFLTNHDMNRVMSDLGDDPAKAKAAAAMLLTGPGTPFIYYGEEIGMLGTKPDEDIRLPMQWSAEEYAGFTSSIPWRRLNLDYPGKNAALQSGEPGSLLSWYRRLIALRDQFPSLQTGDSFPISSKSPAVYSLLRTDGLRHVLVVINLGDKTTGDYALNLDTGPLPNGEYLAFSLIEAEVYPTLTIQEGGFSGYLPLPDLAPYQVLIIELEKGSD